MEDITTYKAIRVDDTAYWRLTIYISRRGMSAYLKNEEDPTEPVVTLFKDSWKRDDDSLLRRIETVVYDHPQLLDDFSTDIVISTDKAVWVPRKEGMDKGEETLYTTVYNAEDEDIFIDESEDMECLYTLVPGLQSFIRRTLPGARTWCQQTVAVRRFRDRVSDMPRIYIDIREDEADFIGFDGKKLLFSTTHPWRDRMEIPYHLYNLIDVFGLDMKNVQVSLSGQREIKMELMQMLREHITYVMLTMMPSAVAGSDMPQAVAMLVSRAQKEK